MRNGRMNTGLDQAVKALCGGFAVLLCTSCCGALAETHFVWTNSPSPSPPYTTWDSAAWTIQEAIDSSAVGDTVLVTNGVYQEGGAAIVGLFGPFPYWDLTNRVALTNAVTVRSVNGPQVTIIRGNSPRGDGAVRCAFVDAGCVLAGFTLTNGAGRAGALSGSEMSGAGVWCEDGGQVSNCWIFGNAGLNGGGAYGGTLWNCVLADNSSANCGGGAMNSTLNNCTLSGNSAHFGGAAYTCTMNNCAVFANAAIFFGGGAFGGSLNHCTITGNSCDSIGGGVYGGGATNPMLNNCIVYYNTAPVGPNVSVSDAALHDCCTTPAPDGTGNITNAPMLVSIAHIAAESPCNGGAAAGSALDTDLDGEPWRDPPSIGADEPSSVSTGLLSVAIAASHTAVSVGFQVRLTALIQGYASGSAWDFGDGQGETNRAFACHAWTGTGTYAVALAAWNTDYPGGITGTVLVAVVEQPVFHVAASSHTPEFPYATWSTAATNIQDAISAATIAGSLVLVSNGSYAVGGSVANGLLTNRVALTNAIFVLGINGPQVTTLSGKGPTGNGAARCAYVGDHSVLAGFTLANGATRASGHGTADDHGGGVWCAADGLVSNCWITGNVATYHGGGAFGGTLVQCSLSGNTASFGGGSSGGLRSRCTVFNNSATEGGGMLYGMANNSLLQANSASQDGGGAHSVTLSNCTLTRNAAFRNGGGLSHGTARNCIVYNNPSGSNWYSSALSYCCTAPNPGGAGNITNAPLFAIDTSDFHLVAGSPCIDRGNNSLVQTATDLDGNVRIFNAIVDMGAYEYPDIGDLFRRWLRDFGLPTDGSADNIDSDGDGLNNTQEYQSGTNPTNPASVTRLISADLEITPRNTLVRLRWASVTNRFYDLSRATNLLEGTNAFHPIPGASNLPATPTETEYTDLIRDLGPYFYRVNVHQ